MSPHTFNGVLLHSPNFSSLGSRLNFPSAYRPHAWCQGLNFMPTVALQLSKQPMVPFVVLSLELMKLRHGEVKVKGKSPAKFTELFNDGARHWAQAATLLPCSLSVTQSWTAVNITISKMQTKEKVPRGWLLGENSNNTIITTGTLNCFVVVELCYMNKLQEIAFSVVRICRGNTGFSYWISKNSCFESHGAAGQDVHKFPTSSKPN